MDGAPHLFFKGKALGTRLGVSKFQLKLTRGLSYLIPEDNLTHFVLSGADRLLVLSLCSLYEQRDVDLDSRAFPSRADYPLLETSVTKTIILTDFLIKPFSRMNSMLTLFFNLGSNIFSL